MKNSPSVAFGVSSSRPVYRSCASSNAELEAENMAELGAELEAELIDASIALSINGFNALFSPRHNAPFQSHYCWQLSMLVQT
jgi:hypothetical protein